MTIDMEERLSAFVKSTMPAGEYRFPCLCLEPDTIKTVMINESSPVDPDDDFYGNKNLPEYLASALALFAAAGFEARGAAELTGAGIYMTNAVKQPKSASAIPKETIGAHVPLLEYELETFPKLRAVMLMGDVAKTAFNMIAKRRTGKNVIPSAPTYKLRQSEFRLGRLRVFPSYIMTGPNLLIEKSKPAMIAEDIANMLRATAD